MDVVMMVGLVATALPQIYSLCRSSTSDGVSLSTLLLTVGLLIFSCCAAILTKWHQLVDCTTIGLARCLPDLLDEVQLVGLDAVTILIVIQVVMLPPHAALRHRLAAAAVIVVNLAAWAACVVLSLLQPCSKTTGIVAQACSTIAAAFAVVQYVPQLIATVRHRGSGALSVSYYALQTIGGLGLFVEQAILSADPWPVWAPMLLSTCLQGLVAVLCSYFDMLARFKRRRIRIQAATTTAQAHGMRVGLLPEAAPSVPAETPTVARTDTPVRGG